MSFNIWMWILLVLFIVGTIAVILILTVGSVLEERSYDRRSEDEKRKNLEKILRCQRTYRCIARVEQWGRTSNTRAFSTCRSRSSTNTSKYKSINTR